MKCLMRPIISLQYCNYIVNSIEYVAAVCSGKSTINRFIWSIKQICPDADAGEKPLKTHFPPYLCQPALHPHTVAVHEISQQRLLLLRCIQLCVEVKALSSFCPIVKENGGSAILWFVVSISR